MGKRGMEFPHSDFWDFSLSVYGAEGVHEACVDLQACYGMDANMLFYGLWHASVGAGVIAPEKWRQILDTVQGWHAEIVRPIWRARQKLKPAFADFPTELTEPLRQMYIEAELNAEHIEQIMLREHFPGEPSEGVGVDQRKADAVANLEGYVAALGIDASLDDKIDTFLQAIA